MFVEAIIDEAHLVVREGRLDSQTDDKRDLLPSRSRNKNI